jgi:hypothetical protein
MTISPSNPRGAPPGAPLLQESSLETVTVHPFEKAGLGLAPFRYVGMVAQDIEYGRRRLNSRDEAVSITTAPGGTCDACGTYIVDMFRIRSADGVESKVGCDCILKVGVKVENAVGFKADQKRIAKAKAAARKLREAARIAEARVLLEDKAEALRLLPSPYANRAARGETMLDHVAWMIDNAGHTGKLQATKIIERA